MSLAAQLKKSNIFKDLTDSELELYVTHMTVETLNAGDMLFDQGETPDALYVVLSGLLEGVLVSAQGQTQSMGNITPGEVVGEMGVLTQQPRVLRIVARENTTLAKMTQEDFDMLYDANPQLLMPITHLIIQRLRTRIASLGDQHVCDTIFLMATHDNLIQPFCACMRDELLQQSTPILLLTESDVGPYLNNGFSEKLKEWEEHYHVILIVLPDNHELLKKIPDHAKRIMILTTGYSGAPLPMDVMDILENNELSSSIPAEVIYCHETRSPMPDNFLPLTHEFFCRRHHLIFNEIKSHQRFLRFLTGKAVGLVIGGGGTRIWAAVGAVQYLLEQGIEIDAVGGTSSGAIIAACVAYHYSGFDFTTLVEEILSIEQNPLGIRNFTYPILSLLNGVAGTKGLQRIFKQHRIEDCLLNLFIVSCSLTSSQEVKHSQGYVWEALRASVSLPGLYPPFNYRNAHHELLVDGGVINNLPTDRMKALLDGRGKIIAIDLSNVSSAPMQAPDLPNTLTFFQAFQYFWQRRSHPEQPNIFDVLFNSLMIATDTKSRDHRHFADVLILPHLTNLNILSSTNRRELITSGRIAAAEKISDLKNLLD